MTKTPQDLQIDVYENARDLGFVGAGIQLAPNMARVLDGLGVWKGIEAEAVNIEDTSVRGMFRSTNQTM
jgi:salicylate hydroxylase